MKKERGVQPATLHTVFEGEGVRGEKIIAERRRYSCLVNELDTSPSSTNPPDRVQSNQSKKEKGAGVRGERIIAERKKD